MTIIFTLKNRRGYSARAVGYPDDPQCNFPPVPLRKYAQGKTPESAAMLCARKTVRPYSAKLVALHPLSHGIFEARGGIR